MNTERLKQLFPTFEEPLFEELVKHRIVKEVKAGEILLRVPAWNLSMREKIFANYNNNGIAV